MTEGNIVIRFANKAEIIHKTKGKRDESLQSSQLLVLPNHYGQKSLILFAKVLKQNRTFWRRVRIEGHTIPPKIGESDDWELSSARAAAVARTVHKYGHIPSYYLAVAGRAGQNPLDKSKPNANDPANERVEIVVEYAQPRFGWSPKR